MKRVSHSRPVVYTLVPVTLALAASSAFAFMIGNLPADKLDPRSCQIVLSQAEKKLPDGRIVIPQVQCSGTIIGKSRLSSAAHCFVGREFTEGEIRCPGDTPKKISSWTIPKDYKETKTPQETAQLAKLDIAVVRIEEEFKTSPAKLPKGPGDMDRLYESTKEGTPPDCGLFGYGENAKFESGEHNGRTVLFEEWKLGTRTWTQTNGAGKVTKTWDEPILGWWHDQTLTMTFRAQDFDSEKRLTNAVRHGDSGGGLICYDENKEPVLMGITGGNSVAQDAGGFEAHVAAVASVSHSLGLLKDLFDRKAENTITGTPTAAPAKAPISRRVPRTPPPGSH